MIVQATTWAYPGSTKAADKIDILYEKKLDEEKAAKSNRKRDQKKAGKSKLNREKKG